MATSLSPQEISERLAEQFAKGVTVHLPPGKSSSHLAIVERELLPEVLAFLKSDPDMDFDFLADVTAVDHLHFEDPAIGERFASVYQLYSTGKNHRFTLKAPIPEDDPRVPSAFELWKSALWAEREAHDMYGIQFEGNPDLRRLLMPQDFPGFPLRKDYPLRGRGERDAFPQYLHSGPVSYTPATAAEDAPGAKAENSEGEGE